MTDTSRTSKYVGMDVHKETIAIGVADAGREAPRYYGEIENTSRGRAAAGVRFRRFANPKDAKSSQPHKTEARTEVRGPGGSRVCGTTSSFKKPKGIWNLPLAYARSSATIGFRLPELRP